MKKHHKAKPIYQYTVNGVFVKEYESTAAAAKALGISRETISLVLRKINKTAAGYQFSFEKTDKMEALAYTRNHMLNVREMIQKRTRETEYKDFGIIENPMSRYFGKRKVLIGKMELYANPDKDINELIEKYSKAI